MLFRSIPVSPLIPQSGAPATAFTAFRVLQGHLTSPFLHTDMLLRQGWGVEAQFHRICGSRSIFFGKEYTSSRLFPHPFA